MNQKLVQFVARIKLRLFIGMGIVTIPATILNLLTFAKVWAPTFEFYGIPPITIYILLPVGFMASCYLIGHYWDMLGIWHQESNYTNMVNNPQVPIIMRDLQEIKEMMRKKE